jgi:hypothetical protein
MPVVGVGHWIRRLFSPSGPEEEAAAREEYGIPDRGEAALERDRSGPYGLGEAAETAEEELDQFKAPPDPNP